MRIVRACLLLLLISLGLLSFGVDLGLVRISAQAHGVPSFSLATTP
jgi:hypothetical protein